MSALESLTGASAEAGFGDNLAVPRLIWRRLNDEQFVTVDADGVGWSIDRHPAVESRQGKTPDWSLKWWLHRLGDDGQVHETPETHETCPIVSRRQVTALNRHRDILRYADVLAAGWSMAWRMPNGHPLSEQLMRHGDVLAPLSALQGDPVLVHPQLLLNEMLRAARAESRTQGAEPLREADLPGRFTATPAEVDQHLRRILAEDTYLRYQQAVGGRAVEEAAQDARHFADGANIPGSAFSAQVAESWHGAADYIDPAKGGGLYPSQLQCSRHNGFGPCPGAPRCTPRETTEDNT